MLKQGISILIIFFGEIMSFNKVYQKVQLSRSGVFFSSFFNLIDM